MLVIIRDRVQAMLRKVEHVGGGAQSQREPRIVRARCRRHARWGIVRGGDHPAELKCPLCYSQPGCLTLA